CVSCVYETGFVFYGICGLMGGFRQLEAWRGHTFNFWGHDFKLAYSGFGLWYITDADEFWWGDEKWPDGMSDAGSLGAGETERTDYRASDIRNIDIEVGGSHLVIQESEDDCVLIARDSDARAVKYQLKNGTFKLYSEKNYRWWNGEPKGTIYLYLPKGMSLDSIDLEIGAGTLESIGLEADEIDVDVDAGMAMIESLYGNEIEASANAGTLEIYEVMANKLSADVGAGSISIQNLAVEDVQLNASAGSLTIEGRIGRNADIECGVGSISMTLQGAETDYDYRLECAMGEIDLDGEGYSGLNKERKIKNGGKGTFEIECSMGSVEINFID
ncbi:MAG: DUF4097 domain-containing protein, partial [Lachnospiraceae bacterium]|nr:DUF4097 domain-containing protein [Lachnospiraceae bacterium]